MHASSGQGFALAEARLHTFSCDYHRPVCALSYYLALLAFTGSFYFYFYEIQHNYNLYCAWRMIIQGLDHNIAIYPS